MRTRTKYLAISIFCILPWSFSFADIAHDSERNLLETQRVLEVAMEAEDYQRALALAERITTLAKEESSAESAEFSTSLRNLAIIQHRMGNFTEAAVNFKRSIEITTAVEGEYSNSLQIPLRYLGKLHFQNQDYADSMQALRRAQHITHRNDGVYSLGQLNILEWITRIHLKTNSVLAADQQQRFYYKVNENNFAADDPRMIAPMAKLGNWFRQSGQYPDALKIYRQTVTLLEQQGSDTNLELIEPLRAISSTLYLQGACCADEPLDRALKIMESHSTTDADDHLEAIINLADMSMVQRNERRAEKLYQEAWRMISENQVSEKAKELFSKPTRLGVSRTDDVVNAFRRAITGFSKAETVIVFDDADSSGGESLVSVDQSKIQREELIGAPLPLCYPQLLDLVKANSKEQIADYFMDIDFSVNQHGQVVEVEVVDTNTPVRLARYVKNMLHRTRFRPRLSEGEPVTSQHMEIHQTFTSAERSSYKSPIPFSKAAVMQGCQTLAAVY